MPMLASTCEGQIADLERIAEPGQDAMGDVDRLGRAMNGTQQQAELVASETGDRVAIAQYRPDPRADRGEQLIAVVMAQGVVDLLEPIEIDHQDGDLSAVTPFRCQRLLDLVAQHVAVGQTGQRVGHRRMLEPALIPAEACQREDEQGDRRAHQNQRAGSEVAAEAGIQRRRGSDDVPVVGVRLRALQMVERNPYVADGGDTVVPTGLCQSGEGVAVVHASGGGPRRHATVGDGRSRRCIDDHEPDAGIGGDVSEAGHRYLEVDHRLLSAGQTRHQCRVGDHQVVRVGRDVGRGLIHLADTDGERRPEEGVGGLVEREAAEGGALASNEAGVLGAAVIDEADLTDPTTVEILEVGQGMHRLIQVGVAGSNLVDARARRRVEVGERRVLRLEQHQVTGAAEVLVDRLGVLAILAHQPAVERCSVVAGSEDAQSDTRTNQDHSGHERAKSQPRQGLAPPPQHAH